MLNNLKLQEKSMDKAERKAAINAYRKRLEVQQQEMKKNNLPVFVILEGWGASGKGSIIGELIKGIDPRFFQVISTGDPTEEENRKPFLWRHFIKIPKNGKFVFLDSGWMDEVLKEKMVGTLSHHEYERRIGSINIFERQLTNNGYLLVKLFLNISKEEQKKRLSKLEGNKDTQWRVSDHDRWQNSHFEEYKAAFESYLSATDTLYAPWHLIDSANHEEAAINVYRILTEAIDDAFQKRDKCDQVLSFTAKNAFSMVNMPMLCDVDLSDSISDEEYEVSLKEAKHKLKELHNRIYRKKIPFVIVYEGWDAAGKGGNIKRVTGALDARGFEVIPVAAPEPYELSRHYLWRFWRKIPETGHFAIFDRSWYGRVMVERVEGLCNEKDWQRSYSEINEFEKELTDWGAVVIKFWLQIDQKTQLDRFRERENTPEKKWKITSEDWRNREKWSEYEVAVNDMLQKTSTTFAPWHIIESVDKKFARIKALKLVIESIEKALK